MNVHHQRVVAHARMRGDKKNIGFVMWCSECRQSYVTADDNVLKCRCPLHDVRAPALVGDNPSIEWLS